MEDPMQPAPMMTTSYMAVEEEAALRDWERGQVDRLGQEEQVDGSGLNVLVRSSMSTQCPP